MQKRLYLLYILLLIYVVIGLYQYNYFKNEIHRKENHIIKLNSILGKNNDKLSQVELIHDNYSRINILLDSLTMKQNDVSKDLSKNKKIAAISQVKKDNNNLPEIPQTTNDKSKTTDTIPQANLVSQKELEEISKDKALKNKIPEIIDRPESTDKRNFLFTDINDVFYNIKRPRSVKSSDKNLWIEIESYNGGYTNALRSMIKGITINGTYVHIMDIRTKDVRSSTKGVITYYYIQVKLPRTKIIHARNQLIINADRPYIKLFAVR